MNLANNSVSSNKSVSSDQSVSSNNSMSSNESVSSDNTMREDRSDSMGHRVGDSADKRSGDSMGSSAVIGDLGHVSVVVVGVVVDELGATVGEGDGVGALSDAGPVVGLGGGEPGAGVVIRHRIVVGEGGDLVGINFDGMSDGVRHGVDGGTDSHAVT